MKPKEKKSTENQPIKKCPKCGSTEFEVSFMGWTGAKVDKEGNLFVDNMEICDEFEIDIIKCANCDRDFTRSDFERIDTN